MIEPARNVVALVRGRDEPEKWVIAGNHRDAWIYGGLDPSSGTAALLEAARAVGTALKHLIFAPEPTYRPELLPRIFEAIQAGDWAPISHYEDQLVQAFDRAAQLLEQAAGQLR